MSPYDYSIASIYVAFAIGPIDKREIVKDVYPSVNPFRRWKPDDDVTVIYDPKTRYMIVLEASPWRAEIGD